MEKALMIIAFIAAGFGGILLHCFIEMNKINKQLNGEFKLRPYMKIERFRIASSVLVVVLSVACGSLIKKLMLAEYWLVPAYIVIGYFGQSIAIAGFGKAADFVKALTGHAVEDEQIIISTKDKSGLT